ncbi:hypothetical protein MmiAt1_12350 [Methanimicrococcus sp. At1]|uniref:MoaD/ThiS family protein n=1 Tax=Methanimicrococcus hacksteinii TaxID=3028293 RepID=A0ABU3VQJ0_9EURY|nr:MoaD/ThiS family protein [Methanimicrococcus sp. At1]MDV0445646.1 hypothetical protein [Methanimicrococcus sp. At1]
MKVSILFLGAGKNESESSVELEIPEQTSVKRLIAEFAVNLLPDPELVLDSSGSLRRHLIIQINKKRILPSKADEYILKEGDEIIIYPPVSGG